MKWFVGLNTQAPQYQYYLEMVQVALWTCRQYTPLEPVLLLDGEAGGFSSWFRQMGGQVIQTESRLKSDLLRLSRETGNSGAAEFGPGVYLRLEIPRIMREQGWKEPYAIYTDCDIVFQQAFRLEDLPGFNCPIAVGPEGDPADVRQWNSGFMVLNLNRFEEVENELIAFMRKDLPDAILHDWDQYSLKRFFEDPESVCSLDSVWNWKPYWGVNDKAKVVHFHGPKPFVRQILDTDLVPPVYLPFVKNGFEAYSSRWDSYLSELRKSTATK